MTHWRYRTPAQEARLYANGVRVCDLPRRWRKGGRLTPKAQRWQAPGGPRHIKKYLSMALRELETLTRETGKKGV